LLDLRFFNKTSNRERYVEVIVRQLLPELTEESFYGWFQQDSATAHTARMSMQALSDTFRDRNISIGIWQAHSPDLNPHDIFFCGSLQGKFKTVYSIWKNYKNIHRETANIPAEQL
jgi:hypothetical protein